MKEIVPLISPTLTIIGWAIAYRLAKVNSTRTESKSIIDSCNAIIDTLSEKGSSFYLSENSTLEEKKSFQYFVNSKITSLHKKLEYLDKRGIALPVDLISDFHIALTLRIPEQGKPEYHMEKCVYNIFDTSSNLVYKLQMSFHAKYPPIESLLSINHYVGK